MKKTEKVEQAKRLLKSIDLNERLVRDNKIEFSYQEKKYRVRMPTTGEEIEANTKRDELRLELLNNDKYMTKNQLIENYKKRGISIKDLDDKFMELQNDINVVRLKLAKVPDENKKAIKSLSDKIMELKDRQMLITQKKIGFLQYSIESKVEHHWYIYLTYLVTEKSEGKKWVKYWKTFKDFENSETQLTGKAIVWCTNLLAGLKISNSILL